MVKKQIKGCSLSQIGKYKSKSWDTTSHPSGRLLSKNKNIENNKCWQGSGKTVSSVCYWWYKVTMEYHTVLPQKIKNRITLWCSNFTSGYISKELKTVLMTYLFTAVLFIIAKKQKQSMCPTTLGVYNNILNTTELYA